jgi:hypothetical protein
LAALQMHSWRGHRLRSHPCDCCHCLLLKHSAAAEAANYSHHRLKATTGLKPQSELRPSIPRQVAANPRPMEHSADAPPHGSPAAPSLLQTLR